MKSKTLTTLLVAVLLALVGTFLFPSRSDATTVVTGNVVHFSADGDTYAPTVKRKIRYVSNFFRTGSKFMRLRQGTTNGSGNTIYHEESWASTIPKGPMPYPAVIPSDGIHFDTDDPTATLTLILDE